ncbi:hypothetical protein TNCV_3616641 [Trichonephila clavipes]|nr:hypothetical protein TNCV_3616641 [Trichonephila clavipes]
MNQPDIMDPEDFLDRRRPQEQPSLTPNMSIARRRVASEGVVQPEMFLFYKGGRGSLAVKASDRGWRVMSSTIVPLKIRCVGQRCTLNLSRSQKSLRWCCMVVRRGSASSDVVLVT